MKMTLRWYGEGNDQIKLSDIMQIPGKDCGKLVTCEEHSIIGCGGVVRPEWDRGLERRGGPAAV